MTAPVYPTARARFRDLVVQLLLAGVPAVEGRVYRARVWPVQIADTPALMVYGYDEVKTLKTIAGGAVKHYSVSCTMAIAGRSIGKRRNPELVEAELELLAGQIEDALLPSPPLVMAQTGVESIDEVRTTMKVEIAGEVCSGELMIAMALRWSEVVNVTLPDVDCEEPTLVMQPLPLLT